jgi:hypothetical protein
VDARALVTSPVSLFDVNIGFPQGAMLPALVPYDPLRDVRTAATSKVVPPSAVSVIALCGLARLHERRVQA